MSVKMLVVQGRPAGKVLEFADGVYYFGRGAECHVRPNSEWVSRQHCMLRVAGRAVTLRDLGSRNGTLVNGVLVGGECRLADGDQVQVGPLVFEVHIDDSSSGRTSAPLPGKPLEPEVSPAEGKKRPTPFSTTEEFPTFPPRDPDPSGPAPGTREGPGDSRTGTRG
jgi:pSer/pThr/pTyr-binding forkhead associated (FHA) protein